MNLLNELNLPTIVSALIFLIGAVFTGLFANHNRNASAKQTREPSWVELTTENRALRADLTAVQDAQDAMRTDLQNLHATLNQKTDELSQKTDAFKSVLEDISRQTPPQFHPRLNPIDMGILEDTLPHAWLISPTTNATPIVP